MRNEVESNAEGNHVQTDTIKAVRDQLGGIGSGTSPGEPGFCWRRFERPVSARNCAGRKTETFPGDVGGSEADVPAAGVDYLG